MVSSNLTRYSPKFAVRLSIPLPAGKNAPTKSTIPPVTAVNACFNISSTANTPLNVLFRLLLVSSLILKFSVKSRIFLVISANCCPVIGGNISLNASLIGLAMLSKPSNAFFTASISMVRPPRSFQSCNILFRASAEALISPLNVSLTSVRSSFASSKSPTIISQLCVHPDCAASFNVLNNWVKVFTFVAASFAVCPIFMIDLICSSEYPIVLSWSSFKSPVNLANVSVRISEVSQPFCNVSRNDPSSVIIWSIAIP